MNIRRKMAKLWLSLTFVSAMTFFAYWAYCAPSLRSLKDQAHERLEKLGASFEYQNDSREIVRCIRITPRLKPNAIRELLQRSSKDIRNLANQGDEVNEDRYLIGPHDNDLTLLSFFPEIEELDLSGCDVTNAGLTYLECLPRLQIVNLRMTKVSIAGVSKLRTWRHIDVRWE